ncbi:hypothetical protein EVAR_7786_1 [Eumeta japonica]|uniref:Uncharacterized protein n=1 Tax=Eumeta variegata TaxID=151549 RepID=A0A4C1TJ26_EUMVA|nr:hypothetical protein EVAR_7786_1 [Eumeta japonica]
MRITAIVVSSLPRHVAAALRYISSAGWQTGACDGRTRSELVNCANGPLLQHKNFLNIRAVSPEQDTIRHQTMETAKINQSGSFDVR